MILGICIMELREIKNLNQRIYELDDKVNRDNKVIFIATLCFCLKNIEFLNTSKLTSIIDFVDENKRPIDQLVDCAENEIEKLNLQESTIKAVKDSLTTIRGANTNLDKKRNEFKNFIFDFITKWYISIKPEDLFFETLYMEIDKKANTKDGGIVLTPSFIAELMLDLAKVDYKKDIVADLNSGTGLFSILAQSRMLSDLNKDFKNSRITRDEKMQYEKRLFDSIIANDNDAKMVTLSLANFLLKNINENLLFYNDVLKLEKSSFKVKEGNEEKRLQPTRAILNPPYEDKFKPLEIIEKNIQLIKNNNDENRLVVIVPPQKFGNNRAVFSKILNSARLEIVIKTQDDLFKDNKAGQPASIFVFNTSRPHKKDDVIHYYNFTDTGYVYLKDSGLEDKNGTFNQKKANLLEKISNASNTIRKSEFLRTWNNFYEVDEEIEVDAQIDPSKIATNKEEADVTLENIKVKKMLEEKKKLIESTNNNFTDKNGSLEKYILDILSED